MVVYIVKNNLSTDARVLNYVNMVKSLGFNVLVLEGKIDKFDKLDLISIIKFIWQYLKFIFRIIYKCLKLKNVEVIHVNNTPNFLVFPAYLVKLIKKSKVILDHHDLEPLIIAEKSKSHFLIKLSEIIQKICINIVDFNICADHNQKSYLLEQGVDNKYIQTVINIANDKIFNPSIYSQEQKKFSFFYHGTISYRLGIDIMINAFKKVIEQGYNASFLIIGEGGFSDEIKQMIKDLNLKNHVKFLNKSIRLELIPKLIEKANVGVIGNRNTLLSKYMLPVKLLEYVKMKLPVIAPANEMITTYFNEEMIIFYEPESVEELSEKMIYSINNLNLLKSYSNKAYRFYNQYNYDTEKKKYQNIINQLCFK